MKVSMLFSILAAVAQPLSARRLFKPPTDVANLDGAIKPRNQIPLASPTMPGDHQPQQAEPEGSGGVLLSDMIGIDRRINIFSSLVRDIESVSLRLDDDKINTTVLAPLNSAIEGLPRKPWEDPEDYNKLGDQAYGGDDGQERANRNLKRFVEAHLVAVNPWKEGDKVTTLGGGEIWWEEKGGVRRIMPGGIEVQAVGRAVSNGQVWVLKEVINYVQ